jgi:hypothetical protein
MKKAALISILFFASAHAQTLTQIFYEPKPGDFEYVFTADTSAYTSGIPAVAGDNLTWDLQLLKISPASETVRYLDSAAVAGSTLYPGCDFVMDRPLYYSYFKSDKTNGRTELLGLSSNTLTLHFNDPAVIIEYPAIYGDVASDLVSGEFDAGFLTGFCAGTSKTSVDGRGTLKLPGGRTYNDVLRVKAILQLTLTAGVLPVGNIEQTVIMFYHSSNKFAMLSLSYTKIQVIGSPASTTSEYTINALKPTGLSDNAPGYFSSLNIFPNPASDVLKIQIPGSLRLEEIKIFDTNGRCVAASDAADIDIKKLESGLYIVRVKLSDGSILTGKFHKI